MMTQRHRVPRLWLILSWVAYLLSACSSEQDPRQAYLDTLDAEFDALVDFLEDFEPGMETREVEFEGPNGRVARADRIVPRSKDIADSLQRLHQHIKLVPLPVLQEGISGFDEWSHRAVTIIETGRDRLDPGFSRILKDYSANPDRYSGNVQVGPEGISFISSTQISILGGLSTSEPEGFGIDPTFLWKMDLEAWVEDLRQKSERFALDN